MAHRKDFYSELFDKRLYVKIPDHGEDQLTTASKLLEHRRQMAEADTALTSQKGNFELKMESIKTRRDELQKREFQLKESLLKFDKFLKENDGKRTRAMKKAAEERDIKRDHERAIDRLKVEITRLIGHKDRLIARCERYRCFEAFLERTAESSVEYGEVRQLMARYDTLTSSQDGLTGGDLENQNEMKRLKQKHLQESEAREHEILGYTNAIGVLQEQLDRAEQESARREAIWMNVRNTAANKTLLIGQIRMSCFNLYNSVVKLMQEQGQKAKELSEEQTFEQLKVIEGFLRDLASIVNAVFTGIADQARAPTEHSEGTPASGDAQAASARSRRSALRTTTFAANAPKSATING